MSDSDDTTVPEKTKGKGKGQAKSQEPGEEQEEPVEEEQEEQEQEEEPDEDDVLDTVGEVDDEDKELASESADEEPEDNNDDIVESPNGEEVKKKCMYQYAQDGDDSDDEDDVAEEIFEDEVNDVGEIVLPKDKRITKPYMTKYERVRLIGDRTKQITLGAKTLIKNSLSYTPREIAELELKNNIIPMFIERVLPNNKKERWYVSELAH